MGSESVVHDRGPAELVAAGRAIAFAARAVEQALGDMTLPQFRVLTLIAEAPGRAGRLAERAAVTRPSLTGLLDGLVARGWVTRTVVAGDRRGVQLEVTPAGARALAEAEAAMAAGIDRVLGCVPSADRDAAVQGLVALGDALRADHARRRAARAARAAQAAQAITAAQATSLGDPGPEAAAQP